MPAHQLENYLEEAEDALECLEFELQGKGGQYTEGCVIDAFGAIGLRERSAGSLEGALGKEGYESLAEICRVAESHINKLRGERGMCDGKVVSMLEDELDFVGKAVERLVGKKEPFVDPTQRDVRIVRIAERIDVLGLAVVGAISLGRLDGSRLSKLHTAEWVQRLRHDPAAAALLQSWAEGLLSTIDRIRGRPDFGDDLAYAMIMSAAVVWTAYGTANEKAG